MQKIILGSLKAVVRNMELVIILFAVNISIKYMLTGINEPVFFYLAISIVVNLYLLTATLKALCQDEKFGKWNWRDYFIGAVKKLPFIVTWILFIIVVINVINFIFEILNLSPSRQWNIFIFCLFAYLTSIIPIAKTIGKSVKESVKIQMKVIRETTLKWIFSGMYIFLIVLVTRIVVFSLWENAIKFKGNSLGTVLVLAGEMARSAAVVAILATVVKLLFAALENKGENFI